MDVTESGSEQYESLRRSLWGFRPTTAAWIGLVDVLALGIFGAISSDVLHVQNLQNIAVGGAQIVLLSVGMAMLLGAGELDISVGANIILSSVIGAKIMVALSGTGSQVMNGIYPHEALGISVGLISCIVCGGLFGLINGLLVTRLQISSFIVTLGMLGIGVATADVITNGVDVLYIPPAIQTGFGIRMIGGIPAPALLVACLVIVLGFVSRKTRFGVRVLGIGSSREAAVRVGINVDRYRVGLFVMVGSLAGLAGFMDISRFATTNINGHVTDALSAIAGAVIGGTSLFGGRCSVPGAVVGALLSVILQNGLVVLGLPAFYQQIAVGFVLIVAVALDSRSARARTHVKRRRT